MQSHGIKPTDYEWEEASEDEGSQNRGGRCQRGEYSKVLCRPAIGHIQKVGTEDVRYVCERDKDKREHRQTMNAVGLSNGFAALGNLYIQSVLSNSNSPSVRPHFNI